MTDAYQLCDIPVTWITTYSSVTGVSLSQQISFTNNSVFGSYGSFTAQITNLWNEYRIESLRLRITPVPGLSTAGLYPTGLIMSVFESQVIPTISTTAISKLPKYKLHALFDRKISIQWRRRADPEDKTFTDTSSAAALVGGIIGFIGAAAPTVGTAYMVVEATAVIRVRGRKI